MAVDLQKLAGWPEMHQALDDAGVPDGARRLTVLLAASVLALQAAAAAQEKTIDRIADVLAVVIKTTGTADDVPRNAPRNDKGANFDLNHTET
jgi:hypothetical protein